MTVESMTSRLSGSTAFQVYGAVSSDTFNRPARFGPSTPLAHNNAMLSVHTDTPFFIRWRYSGMTSLMFQFIDMPISESQNPKYEMIETLGRSEAYVSYQSTENRKIPLKLAFVSSAAQGDNGQADDALRCARWIQSLTLPHYLSGGVAYPPPILHLILGRFLNVRCVLTGFSLDHEAPFGGDDKARDRASVFQYPMLVRCECEFTVVNRSPKDASDLLRSIRGPVGTF